MTILEKSNSILHLLAIAQSADIELSLDDFDENDFSKIARIMLDELKAALAEKNITFKYSQPAVEYIARSSYSRKFGARNMRRFIQNHIEDAIAEKVINANINN